MIRKSITWLEMKKATVVATAHPASEMMSMRRSASRCSITDMRCSSTGTGVRGKRWRTLSRRATDPASVLLWISLGRRALGGALGGRHRGRVGRRFRLRRLRDARDLVGQLTRRLPELAHGLADGATELGQPARPEDDQDDDQEQNDPDPVHTEHFEPDYRPRVVSPRSGSGQETTLIAIEVMVSLVVRS